MTAVLTGSMAVDGPPPWVKKDLTLKIWDHINEESSTFRAYVREGKTVRMPRQYGMSKFIDHVDETSNGCPMPVKMTKLKPRDYQVGFIEDLYAFHKPYFATDCIAEAATGKGKTVMSLEVARRLDRTTLVVVDQEFLRDQWIEEAMDKFGLPREAIGIVQGDTFEVDDKSLVVGMVQTLHRRKYSETFYDYFGTVIFDECHTVGAEQFSKVLGQFSARNRWGVSATPDRADEYQKVLEWHLGKVEIKLTHKHKKSKVRYIEYDGVLSWYANISPKNGRYLAELTADDKRNWLLATAIRMLVEAGHNVLAVSDRVEHCHAVMGLCRAQGVAQEDMGVVAGYNMRWQYAKDATPPRKPVGLAKGADYTPVSLQFVRKKVTKREQHQYVKDNARVVFATYGMFNKGVDAPRLSAGIDMTPRSNVKQVHGRILRIHDGKLTPVWVTIRDIMSYKAEHQFLKRLSDYVEDSAEIYQWNITKGTRKVEVRDLKREARSNWKKLKEAKIVTNLEGQNIVMM